MDGSAYLITEIVVFLVIATLLGGLIGWLLARRSRGRAVVVAPEPARPGNDELQAELARLKSVNEELAGSAAEVEALRKELAQARWQISTLEEALVPKGADGAKG